MAAPSIRDILNLIGAAAAASFAASAIIHVFAFLIVGLNFASFGSTSDVVLGGFRLLSLWSSIAVGVIAYFSIMSRGKKRESRASDVIYAAIMAILLVVLMVIIFVRNLPNFFAFSAVLLSGSMIAWITKFILGLTIEDFIEGAKDALRHVVVTWLLVIVSGLAAFTTFGADQPWRVVETEQLPTECRREHRIWWIGSQATILFCNDRPYALMMAERQITFARR